MPKEDNKALKYNHGEKSMKLPFIIYAELESLFEKMSNCQMSILCIKQKKLLKKYTIK